MSQVECRDGDLYIIFSKNDGVLVSHRLDNGAEIDFFNDELVQIVLPNFEVQLNRGSLIGLEIELLDTQIDGDTLTLPIKIINDVINIKLDISSLRHKL